MVFKPANASLAPGGPRGGIGTEVGVEWSTHPGDQGVQFRERGFGVCAVFGAPVRDHERDRGIRGHERAE